MDAREQLVRAEGKLAYVASILSDGGLNVLEAKEYAALEVIYMEEIARLKTYISDHNL